MGVVGLLISVGATRRTERLLVEEGSAVERVARGVDRPAVKGSAAAAALMAAATDSSVGLGPSSPTGPKC